MGGAVALVGGSYAFDYAESAYWVEKVVVISYVLNTAQAGLEVAHLERLKERWFQQQVSGQYIYIYIYMETQYCSCYTLLAIYSLSQCAKR